MLGMNNGDTGPSLIFTVGLYGSHDRSVTIDDSVNQVLEIGSRFCSGANIARANQIEKWPLAQVAASKALEAHADGPARPFG